LPRQEANFPPQQTTTSSTRSVLLTSHRIIRTPLPMELVPLFTIRFDTGAQWAW
jgi:hypothetical protein